MERLLLLTIPHKQSLPRGFFVNRFSRAGTAAIPGQLLLSSSGSLVEALSLPCPDFGCEVWDLPVASLLGRHYIWTYRQIYAGKVRVISNLGRIMISRTEVDRLLQARRRTTERNSPIRRSRARKPVTVPASAEFFRRGLLAPPRESWGGARWRRRLV